MRRGLGAYDILALFLLIHRSAVLFLVYCSNCRHALHQQGAFMTPSNIESQIGSFGRPLLVTLVRSAGAERPVELQENDVGVSRAYDRYAVDGCRPNHLGNKASLGLRQSSAHPRSQQPTLRTGAVA